MPANPSAAIPWHRSIRFRLAAAAILHQLVGKRPTDLKYIVVFDPRGEVLGAAGSVPSNPREDLDVLATLADLTYDTQIQKRLRIDVRKIDQSFVRDLLTDDEDHAIVEGVISLTRTFKRQVIAEGVESAEIGGALLQLGCSLAQGYGIAKPMPAADLPHWIAHWQPYPQWRS